MQIEEFWSLLDGLPVDSADVELKERLVNFDLKEIISFYTHLERQFIKAYNWELWGAAYLVLGGCSDDGFIDFRYGLIARGGDVFDLVLATPDSLADLIKDEDDFIPNESFGYVLPQLYEEKTGEEFLDLDIFYPDEPTGEKWDFSSKELYVERLPKLWLKYCDNLCF